MSWIGDAYRSGILACVCTLLVGCAGRHGYREFGEAVVADQPVEASSVAIVPATIADICHGERSYKIESVSIDNTQEKNGRYTVEGDAYYENAKRYEPINFRVTGTANGKVRCDAKSGEVYVEAGGSAVLTGMKPLVRSPRVTGSSPRFRAIDRRVGVAPASIYVSVSADRELWCFMPAEPILTGQERETYSICVNGVSESLIPWVVYEVDNSGCHKLPLACP